MMYIILKMVCCKNYMQSTHEFYAHRWLPNLRIRRKWLFIELSIRFVIPLIPNLWLLVPPHSKCVVDISRIICSCKLWDLFSTPCQQVMAGLSYNNARSNHFVRHWLRQDIIMLAYERFIGPNPWWAFLGKRFTRSMVSLVVKKMLGKPKKQRKKAIEESSDPH